MAWRHILFVVLQHALAFCCMFSPFDFLVLAAIFPLHSSPFSLSLASTCWLMVNSAPSALDVACSPNSERKPGLMADCSSASLSTCPVSCGCPGQQGPFAFLGQGLQPQLSQTSSLAGSGSYGGANCSQI